MSENFVIREKFSEKIPKFSFLFLGGVDVEDFKIATTSRNGKVLNFKTKLPEHLVEPSGQFGVQISKSIFYRTEFLTEGPIFEN